MDREQIASSLSNLDDILQRDFDKINEKSLFSATGNGFAIFFVPYNDQEFSEVIIDEMNRRLKDECSHSFVEHPCPSQDQIGKLFCELCGAQVDKLPPPLMNQFLKDFVSQKGPVTGYYSDPEKLRADVHILLERLGIVPLREFEEPHSYDDGRGA